MRPTVKGEFAPLAPQSVPVSRAYRPRTDATRHRSVHVHEEQHFEVKEYKNLQPYWPLCIPYVGCLCFPCIVTGDHRLVLEEDEAVLHKSNICLSSVERRPYAQLGDVQHVKCCT